MRTLALAPLLSLLALTPLAAQPDPKDPQTLLDQSASWGIELETGQIAIDPSLVVYADSHSRTVIINPKYTEKAAEQLGAKVLEDGSFGLKDGTKVRPIVAERVIRTGKEPEGLLEDSGLPVVELDRVRLMALTSDEATAAKDEALREAGFTGWLGELRLRLWRSCSTCNSCPSNLLCRSGIRYTGNRYLTCGWSFRTSYCLELARPQCSYSRYFCRDCSGLGVLASTVGWNCGRGC